jgi:VRR-NUC domain
MAQRGQINLFTRRIVRPPPAPELSTHVMVADLLRRWANPNWRHSHLPLGEYRTPATARKLQRMGVVAGLPDFILLAPTGIAHFLELKRGRASLTEEQQEFANWCVAHGVPYAIARNFDEALRCLKAWGAIRVSMEISA